MIDGRDRNCLGQRFCSEVGLYPTTPKYQVNIDSFKPKNAEMFILALSILLGARTARPLDCVSNLQGVAVTKR